MKDPRKVLERLELGGNIAALRIGSDVLSGYGTPLAVRSPVDGAPLARIDRALPEQVDTAVERAALAFRRLRTVPAPRRGELVRRLGNRLRERKEDLAELVTWEAGKTTQESLGEVQEMIDMCDFAVGQSRMLHGVT